LLTSKGWYNNCASWSGYFSKGAANAFIDLNMRVAIQRKIFRFYLPMTAASFVIQLAIAGFIIQSNWEVIQFTTWSDDENRGFFNKRRRSGEVEMGIMPPASDQGDQSKKGALVSVREVPAT
jgi:hypothetical protein